MFGINALSAFKLKCLLDCRPLSRFITTSQESLHQVEKVDLLCKNWKLSISLLEPGIILVIVVRKYNKLQFHLTKYCPSKDFPAIQRTLTVTIISPLPFLQREGSEPKQRRATTSRGRRTRWDGGGDESGRGAISSTQGGTRTFHELLPHVSVCQPASQLCRRA